MLVTAAPAKRSDDPLYVVTRSVAETDYDMSSQPPDSVTAARVADKNEKKTENEQTTRNITNTKNETETKQVGRRKWRSIRWFDEKQEPKQTDEENERYNG